MIDKALTDFMVEYVIDLCTSCECDLCFRWLDRLNRNGNEFWDLLDDMRDADLGVEDGFREYKRIWR